MIKKIFFLFIFFFIYFFIFPSSIIAATYYVAKTGCSDSYSGTSSQPWCTISKAAGVAAAGDKVTVRAGLYNERINFAKSGTASSPIIFEGERGGNGEWLTIVNGGDLVTGWQTASEIGPGVYKTTLPYNSYGMTADGKDVPRLGWSPGSPYEGYIFLKYPADKMVTTNYEGISVNYWDGIEALYYPVYSSGSAYTTYIRFRNGDNPGTKSIYSSPATGTFLIDNKSYITVKNFKIFGGQSNVEIRGASATHNIIDGNEMSTGQKRVYLRNGTSYNEIRNNEMFMDGLSSYLPGGWNCTRRLSGAARYAGGVKEHIYWVYKHEVGNGTTYSPDDDCGVMINNAGLANEIHHNHIYNSLAGIDINGTAERMKIYNNTIHNTSSINLGFGKNMYDVEVFDNLLYDSNGNFRIQDMDMGNRRIYIYRNRIYNGHGWGDNTYFHWETSGTPSSLAEIWFYHNTYVGACWGTTFSNTSIGSNAAAKTMIVNSVYSPTSSSVLFDITPQALGAFDYNWAGGQQSSSYPSWFGSHNIRAPGQQIWPDETMPDFNLPVGSAARNAGIDLSKPFVINGVTYQPLPGMTPGYFSGTKPDLGAVQSGGNITPPPSTPTPRPTNTPIPTGSYLISDINRDGRVDRNDVLAVLVSWLTAGSSTNANREDVNKDSKVNGLDFGLVMKDWGRQ